MSVRPQPSVLWREGMFLGPQHLQAFSREVAFRMQQGDAVGLPGRHGLLALALDEEALERDVLVVQSAQVVLKDGTLAAFPDTASVLQREFGEQFTQQELDVWLGVHAPRENVPQVRESDDERGARYAAEPRTVFDENLRDAPREIEVRLLQGRLFFGQEDRSGFECVPIARLVRVGKPVAKSALSPTYVPPLLACGASPVLMAALKAVDEKARSHARDLAGRVPATALLSSVEKGADIEGFVKLQSVNQCVVALDQVAHLPDLHPYETYMRLVASIGTLAVFGASRIAPELPAYDHDDLDRCFGAALATLNGLLDIQPAVPYDKQAFGKDAEREGLFTCALPKEWTEGSAVFYLGVQLARSAEDAAELVSKGVKLISPTDVDKVMHGVVPGIELDHQRRPPLSFPKRPDLHYFRVATEGTHRKAWLKILEKRSAVVLSALGALGEVGFEMYVELLDRKR